MSYIYPIVFDERNYTHLNLELPDHKRFAKKTRFCC